MAPSSSTFTSPSNPTALARLRPVLTRSISPENFDGSPGGGGRATEGTGAEAARDLGQGWKVSPSVDVKAGRSEEHTSELQSRGHLVCRLLLEKKKHPLLHAGRRP